MIYKAEYMLNLDKKISRILTLNDIKRNYLFKAENDYLAFQIANLYSEYINQNSKEYELKKVYKIKEIEIPKKIKAIKYNNTEDLEKLIYKYKYE